MGIHEINQLSDLSLALNFQDLSSKIISVDDVTVDIKLYTSINKNIQILIKNGASQGGNKVGDVVLFNDVAATISIGNDSNHEAYMKNTDMNIQRAGIYDKVLLEKITADTQAKLYMSKGASTTGAGYLVIEHC